MFQSFSYLLEVEPWSGMNYDGIENEICGPSYLLNELSSLVLFGLAVNSSFVVNAIKAVDKVERLN